MGTAPGWLFSTARVAGGRESSEWLCCYQCLKNDDVNMAPAVGLWSPWGPEERSCPDLPSTLCSANRRPSLHLSLQKLNNFLRQRRGV